MVVGFYVHKNMDFVITERKEASSNDVVMNAGLAVDAGAIAGAYEE